LASSAALEPDERFDILIHALAQLPDEVTLGIWGDGTERGRLERLASAYGIEPRLRIDPERSQHGEGRIVYPSVRNASTAPLRPSDSTGPALMFDPGRQSHGAAHTVSTMAELLHALSRPDDPHASCRHSAETLDGVRAAVVTNLPAPYRVPLFAELHGRLAVAGASLRVFFLGAASGRPWMTPGTLDFDHEFARSVPIPLGRRNRFVPLDLRARLDRFRPDLLLVGGFSPLVTAPLARYGRARGIPYGLWSGEIEAKSRARQLQRALLARRASFGVAYGFLAAEYLRALRPELPTIYGRNTSGTSAPCRRGADADTVELLTVGDLTFANKGIDVLLDALRLAGGLRCRLTVIGGGRKLPELAATAATDSRIRFVGPLLPAAVRDAYASSDVFLFPTRADVFGLALVEAMASGLAPIVSSAAGAVADLAVAGWNCLIIEGHDPGQWASAITRVVEDGDLRLSLAEQARITIRRRWTIEHSADAIVAAFRLAMVRDDFRLEDASAVLEEAAV
jgi:glycosyltransferase involved in cell wall biosynthesis